MMSNPGYVEETGPCYGRKYNRIKPVKEQEKPSGDNSQVLNTVDFRNSNSVFPGMTYFHQWEG
jgi:hypothetical protein